MAKYRKAIVALAGVLVVIGQALGDGAVSSQEALNIIVAVGVAVGVFQVPNKVAQ